MRTNKLIAIFISLFVSVNLFGQSSAKISEEEKITTAMLMNHLFYSLETIKYYNSRLVIDQEYNIIFRKIDENRLRDKDVLRRYKDMLDRLTELKLNDNEKIFLEQHAEKEKKEAIYKTLEGTALSSIYGIQQIGSGIKRNQKGVTQIIQGATSLLYSGVSAFFNYRNATNAVENQLNKELFRLSQDDFGTIEYYSNELWETCAKLINRYDIKQYKIDIDQLEWLVKKLDTSDYLEKIRLLESKKDIFALFTPFWYELGTAYQEVGNYGKAVECYKEFENQKKKYSVIDNDSYYTELAKNMIYLIHEGKSNADINKYIEIIKQDKTASTESENKLYLASVYKSQKQNKQALEMLEWVIDNKEKYVVTARDFYESIIAENNKNASFVFLLNQLTIASVSAKEECINNNLDWIKQNNCVSYIKKDNLTFVLPKEVGERIKLDVIDNDIVFDSISVSDKNLTYFFLNKNEIKTLSKIQNLKVFITDDNSCEFTLNYIVSFYPTADVKLINNSFETMSNNNSSVSLDYSDLTQINLAFYLSNYKSLIKQKDFKSYNGEQKAKEVSKCYEKAVAAFLYEPYLYRNNILVFDKKLITYGLQTIETKNNLYSFNKYGESIDNGLLRKIDSSVIDLYQAAAQRNSSAMYQYGYKYLIGEGVPIDYIEAVKWFKLSANKKNPDAYYQLGNCFDKGLGVQKDSNRAKYYYSESAKLGNSAAQKLLSGESRIFAFFETNINYDEDGRLIISKDNDCSGNIQKDLFMNIQIKSNIEGKIKSNSLIPAKIIVSTKNNDFLISSVAVVALKDLKNTYENGDNVYVFSIEPSVLNAGKLRFKLYSDKPCDVNFKLLYEGTSVISIGAPQEIDWKVQFN